MSAVQGHPYIFVILTRDRWNVFAAFSSKIHQDPGTRIVLMTNNWDMRLQKCSEYFKTTLLSVTPKQILQLVGAMEG